MRPFPPQIVIALLSEPRRHEPNQELPALRKRYRRSRLRQRRVLRVRDAAA